MSQFLSQYGGEIATLTVEHIWLTAIAMLIATGISLPVGIWLTRAPRWSGPIITIANVLETIPSLAMFGFLLPLPWLGERAARIAIAALTAYALLPILRNTYAGIRGIDPSVLEVARALGMTGTQRLFKVELPLAASFILAGLRTATVTCVGIATIAAAVGASPPGAVAASAPAIEDAASCATSTATPALTPQASSLPNGASPQFIDGWLVTRRSTAAESNAHLELAPHPPVHFTSLLSSFIELPRSITIRMSG